MRQMESASDRGPGSMSRIPREIAPASLPGRRAGYALVFAVHPLRVESIASATERRDVFSGLFYVPALLGYLKDATTTHDSPAARLLTSCAGDR